MTTKDDGGPEMTDAIERKQPAPFDLRRLDEYIQFAEARKSFSDAGFYREVKAEIDQLRAENAELKTDAVRYRWLRRQNWNDAELCVVANPKAAVNLGHDCPSLERLDLAIDIALREQEKPNAE